MAQTSRESASWQPAGTDVAGTGGPRPSARGSVLAFVVIVAGSVVLGLAAGWLWAVAAPRPLFTVTGPGQASLVQAETTAFIAGDAWYTCAAVVGGTLIGLLGRRFAVRRYGPLPMAAIGIGGVAAAVAARWSGQGIGMPGFNHQLAVARPGTLLHAPVMLGAGSAMAMWPLAALLAAGGMEVLAVLRARPAATPAQPGYPGPVPPGPAAYREPYRPDTAPGPWSRQQRPAESAAGLDAGQGGIDGWAQPASGSRTDDAEPGREHD